MDMSRGLCYAVPRDERHDDDENDGGWKIQDASIQHVDFLMKRRWSVRQHPLDPDSTPQKNTEEEQQGPYISL